MPVGANTSMTAKTHPFSAWCEAKQCVWRIGFHTEEEAALSMLEHDRKDCPRIGHRAYLMEETNDLGQPYTELHLSKSILEKLWDELDATMMPMMTQRGGEEFVGKCRGLAFAILLMSTPYFDTADEVSREAMMRYKIAIGEKEFKPTPGYKFNPPPVGTNAYNKSRVKVIDSPKKGATTRRVAAKTAQKQYIPDKMLTPEEVESIREAVSSGMFELEDCASMFKVTVDQIKALLD